MVLNYSVKNLSFQWDQARKVFSEVTFSLKKGEVLCIIGPNGTGKSTLLRCMINLLRPCAGDVYVHGEHISEIDRLTLARKIAFVPQGYDVTFPYSIMEYVLMGRAPFISPFSSPKKEDIQVALNAIKEVGISHLIHKHINEISGGEHQMALIARALAQNPEFLLLDEPTSHLDFGNQMQILDLIERLRNRGISIVMTSHYPDHAIIVSDLVAIMHNGGITSIGPVEEVITGESLKATYNIDVLVEYIEVAGRKVCIPMKK